ncbi:MAG: hypothetical protein HC842_07345 [Cytophagales bacterium]|nr:hypothetical protein [Cytophagales bacterium]
MAKLTNAIRLVSIFLLLAAFLFSYANMPEQVLVFESGADTLYVSREQYFYYGLTLLVGLNALFMILRQVSRRALADSASAPYRLISWFLGMAAASNIFLASVALFLMAKNNPGFMVLNGVEGLLVAFGLLFVLAWVLYLPFALWRPFRVWGSG